MNTVFQNIGHKRPEKYPPKGAILGRRPAALM